MDKSLVNKARQMLASVLIAALCICNMAVPAFAEEAVAASFRLYQTEGTVTVQNQNGKEITAMQDMKLFNGYQVSTEQRSYAWFEADSSKLFKMDAVSNLEVRKKGKQSELLLNSGNLFFNVTEHLQDDEVLNIRTSSMVVGIRGTSGWVKVIDQYHTILYMLDGSVEASVTDPVSGQRKSITLRGGQRAEFWIYNKDKQGDKCDIIVRQYGEDEIDGFVAVELKKNQQLQDRIRGGGGSGAGGSTGGGTAAGFDLVSTIEKAEERLKQDQEEVAKKLAEIEKMIADLAHKVDVDPVFSNNTSKDDSGSDGGASGGSTTTTDEGISDPTTLTMPVTDDTVNDYLNNKKVSVILQPSSNASDNVLTVDSGLTVPSGKSLTAGTGISANVQSGQTLQVDGHMEMEGSLTNAGTVNNTSANTLQIGGDLDNAGTLDNSTGRLIVLGRFLNGGTLTSGNIIENSSAVENTGTFVVNGGTVESVNLNGGSLQTNGGTVAHIEEKGGALQFGSGTISSLTINQGNIVLTSGSITTVMVAGGSFELNGGNAESVTVTGGTFAVTDGNAKDVNVTGAGTIALRGGYEGTLVVTEGTVDAQSGAEIDRVEARGGTFELNGGTVLNGIVQSGSAKVALNSGVVKTTDASYPAIQIDTGNLILNLDGVTVSSDLAGNLLQINGGTIQPESKSIKETVLYGPGSVAFCEPEAGWYEVQKLEGPYKLNGVFPDLVTGLEQENKNNRGGIYVLSEDVTLNDETGYGYEIGNAICAVELNGKTLDINSNFRVGFNGDASYSTSQFFAIHDETGNGTLKLDGMMAFQQYINAVFKNLNFVLGETAVLTTGTAGCQSLSLDHVTVTEDASASSGLDALIEAENIGYLKIDNVIGENMTRCLWKGGTVSNISDSTLTRETMPIFWINSNIEKASVTYEGHVVISSGSGAIGWSGSSNPEDLQRILPKPEQCSSDIDSGVVIRMKDYGPGFPDMLKKAGYKLDPDPRTDTSAVYGYIMPDDAVTLALLDVLATPSDIIPIEDMPIATDSDADSINDEITDEDEDYEKSTPSNADEYILDEDEPYQDEDDESEDEENRNIPVEPVTPALPSTSPEDTTPSEEDPDPQKKDEKAETNNSDQEQDQNSNQNPKREEEQEPEQEPEKETADLVNTELSIVSDPREEEES